MKANISDVKLVKPVKNKREPVWSAGVGLPAPQMAGTGARQAGHETLYLLRCELNTSEMSEAIFDCTGGIISNLFWNLLQRRLFAIFDCASGKGNKC